MPKVFIPQLPTRWDQATAARVPAIDVNSAAAFGELVVMFDAATTRTSAIRRMKTHSREIGRGDLVMAVGDVTLLTLALVHTVLRHGSATLLRWDNDSKSYRTEVISE